MSAEINRFMPPETRLAANQRQGPTMLSRIMSTCGLANMLGQASKESRLNRAKLVTEIRSLARSHTRMALNVLVGVMRSKDATTAARVSMATAILDRGSSKVPEPIQNGDGGALQLIHRIERIILHPENSHS